jgi:lipopolysaccharide export LptBFGC system permease protein LptF
MVRPSTLALALVFLAWLVAPWSSALYSDTWARLRARPSRAQLAQGPTQRDDDNCRQRFSRVLSRGCI